MQSHERVVIGGVDTHKDVHVAAVIDERGKILSNASFGTDGQGLSPARRLDALASAMSPRSASKAPAPMGPVWPAT